MQMQTFTRENTQIGKWIALADDNDAPGVLVEVVEVIDGDGGPYAYVVDDDDNGRALSFPFFGWQQV